MGKSKYYQRPDGLFESIRKINGKRVAFRGHSCREVDRKILEYKEKLETGRTVKEVLDDWQRVKEKSISESSRNTYKMGAKIIEEYIGGKYIKDAKPLDFARIVERMKERGYSGSSVEIMLTVAKQTCAYAVIQGDIDINPVREVTKPKGMPKKRRGYLTPEQVKAVTEYRGDNYLIGIALLYTGCRRGELLALRYEDIDRKAKKINIGRKLSYATGKPVIDDHTKTDAGMRSIPLLPLLEELLPKNRLGLIFHDENGDPIGKHLFYRMWKDYANKLQLYDDHGDIITAHWFRHTFATICYDADIDAKSTAAILGHSSEKITLDIYTHLTKAREQASSQKLMEYFGGKKEKKEAASD